MEQYNILNGDLIPESGRVPIIKKMCLNCLYRNVDLENSGYVCINEAVMETGKKKILESVPDGFEIEELKLKPMKLKNPTKKCANHSVDEQLVTTAILEEFNL